MSDFCSIVEEAFSFLESEFSYSLDTEREEEWGGEVVYSNPDTGLAVRILYEHSSAFIFVFICRLVGGKVRSNPRPILPESAINCFDFNDALSVEDKMKPAYEYSSDAPYFDDEKGLENYVNEFSARLRKHGTKILQGDLSIFPKMEEIIKSRALEHL